jgi:hypothetical protein
MPPELKDTPVGFQSSVGFQSGSGALAIPLDMSREMANQQPPQLTPSALFESQTKLDAMRLQIYNRLLAAVQQKIRAHSALPNSTQMTSFDFPSWYPGCPRFDVKDCILYVAWNLRHSGFKVLYVSPDRLLISWKEQSIQYYQEESPIRQAMLAAAKPAIQPKVEKKKPIYNPAPEGVAAMLANGAKKSNVITFI